MNYVDDDVHKVWEIRTLKKKVGDDEARRFLETIAKEVQPIMRNHKWSVELLSEMGPEYPGDYLGLNIDYGRHVLLRLRRPNRDWDFYPFHEVVDTMLHELCHNAILPHNAKFHKLWGELRKEYASLGGQTTVVAAVPKPLGGDKFIMSALTAVQAAAMAAERRLQDIWCGLSVSLDQMVQNANTNAKSHKRNRQLSASNDISTNKKSRPTGDSSTSNTKSSGSGWECMICTLLNPALAAVCEVCGIHKPKAGDDKTWSCKFCTLENSLKVEKCEACGQWRYSHGQPIATPSPNVAT